MAYAVDRPARSATSTPATRSRMTPCQGSWPSNRWFMSPVPRVSVRNSERKPMSPREEMRYSSRTLPCPGLTIFTIFPLRPPTLCVTAPRYGSGTSRKSNSTGSRRTLFCVLVTTSGRETESSNPSRRIISMRIASCSSPRPITVKESVPEKSTRSATLPRSSLSRRSRSLRDRTRVLRVGHRVADGSPFRAGQRDDVPGGGLPDLVPRKPVVGIQHRDLDLLCGSFLPAHRNRLPCADGPVEDPPDRQPAHVIAVVEVRDKELEDPRRVPGRRRNVGEDPVEQRAKVG